jgi:DNA-binding FrmR family transcriptional regulator
MLPQYKKEAALRLKVAAGHLEGVRRMVDEDVYCVDLMKQLAAVQGTLEGVQRILLRNHLSSCVSEAISKGMGEQIIDELMGALKYDKSLIDGRGTMPLEGVLAGDAAATDCCTPSASDVEVVDVQTSGSQGDIRKK